MTLPATFAARLERPHPVRLDGGTGGELEDRGVDVKNPLWSSVALLDHAGRAANRALHADYAAAGAEILIANTHNASYAHCARFLAARPDLTATPAELLERLHLAALEDARAEANEDGWVAGCLASPDVPYTEVATLAPGEVRDALEAQWRVMAALAPDFGFFEMLTTEADVRGVAALDPAGPSRGAGLVCRGDGRMRGGLELEEAVARLADAGFDLVFVQCTRFGDVDAALGPLLRAAERHGLVPGVYANDGRRWEGGAWCGPRISPEAYAAAAVRWAEAGARIVGGCCGTGPAHIQALNRLLGM